MIGSESFTKKTRQLSVIPGTKPSVQNAQLLVSTGIPSLDFILGGGQAVGTLLLIEEDNFNEYANIVLKYFLAEGAVSGHSLFFGSLEGNTESLLDELPAPVSLSDQGVKNTQNDIADSLKIAWRYENKNPINTELENRNVFGHNFDLSKIIDANILSKINICYWNEHQNLHNECNSYYENLLLKLANEIDNNNFATQSNIKLADRNILRVAIQSLASPFWKNNSECTSFHNFCTFLYKFKALIRSAFAVAIVSVPAHIMRDQNILKLHHIADICVGLESFTGSERATNPLFKEYNGLFHVYKVASINSLAPSSLHYKDLAFKLRRKKFCIEKLHLPPELQESSEREQDDLAIPSCGTKNHLLEF
ncbi:elongator complex protein 4 [Ctenocephalides felis]|uniref:elongator complex protein 4 n=1 Tax=Ctenocephalides felis TaxID=7515 RepID=UPI000E6E1841|nr:elongator complex protein 4 [Ctenocephalides felis]